MNQEQIKMLIDAFAASDLSMLEFSENGCTLRLALQGAALPATGGNAVAAAGPDSAGAAVGTAPLPAPAPGEAAAATADAPAPAPGPTPAADVTAPLYGVVHLRPAPGEPAFVQVGEVVEAGRTLCVIEAMKVFNEVHAPRGATIAAVDVESGQEVDAGQVLFRLG